MGLAQMALGFDSKAVALTSSRGGAGRSTFPAPAPAPRLWRSRGRRALPMAFSPGATCRVILAWFRRMSPRPLRRSSFFRSQPFAARRIAWSSTGLPCDASTSWTAPDTSAYASRGASRCVAPPSPASSSLACAWPVVRVHGPNVTAVSHGGRRQEVYLCHVVTALDASAPCEPSSAPQQGVTSMRPTVLYIAVAVLVAGSVLVPSVRARAQNPHAVQSIAAGTRVRITAPGALTPARQAGQLLALHPDTLVLLPDGSAASLALPLAGVTGIEVSRRRHRSTGTGILIGVLAGGATGAAVGAATYKTPKPSAGCADAQFICGPFGVLGRGGATTGGALLGAVVGGVVGGFVGHAHQSDDWATIPFARRAAALLSAPNHLSITPAKGGVALSFGLRFGGA